MLLQASITIPIAKIMDLNAYAYRYNWILIVLLQQTTQPIILYASWLVQWQHASSNYDFFNRMHALEAGPSYS